MVCPQSKPSQQGTTFSLFIIIIKTLLLIHSSFPIPLATFSKKKVPAIAYGGPKAPADDPSPESTKIAESLVLVEFIADLFPNSSLHPKDPVQLAQARFFIEVVSSKLVPGWASFVMRGESADQLLAGFEAIQNLLPADKAFAVGDEVTIADLAIAPFLARTEVAIKNEIGKYKAGEGLKVYEIYKSDKFSKLRNYFERIKARDSFKKTFDEVRACFISCHSCYIILNGDSRFLELYQGSFCKEIRKKLISNKRLAVL